MASLAVSGTDMGHMGSMGGDDEALFGGDPQKRIDFAYRARRCPRRRSSTPRQRLIGPDNQKVYRVVDVQLTAN